VVSVRSGGAARGRRPPAGILPGATLPAGAGQLLGISLGAFLGPFGGNVVQVLLPVLQHWYGVDVNLAALSVTAYVAPFAAAQFVSGALADHFGRSRLLVAGFTAFGLASLWGAAAPTYGGFLAARAAQGLANAFTTPLLLATLGDRVEPARLGRALGWFGAANTAGLFLAPLVAGALATRDWRLVYLLLAAASGGLALAYASWGRHRPDPDRTPGGQPPGGLRDVLTPRLGALCLCALLGYLSLNGVGFLVALYAAATFGLDPAQTGLLLAGFGLANMLAAAPMGVAVDRLGSLTVCTAAALIGSTVLALLPAAPTPWGVGVLLVAGGAAVAGLWAGLTKLALQAAPTRRATASSLFNAWKFVGYALAPLLYAPLYVRFGAAPAFAAAAAATALILLPLAYLARSDLRRRARRPT
jgi:MFS family permease